MSEAEHMDQGAPEGGFPLPPPSFTWLVLSLRSQIEMALGLLHFGSSEEASQPDLDLARHSIDLLAILQEKTKGNLTLEEQRFLDNSLTELRFRFVQVAQEQQQKKAAPPPPQAESHQA